MKFFRGNEIKKCWFALFSICLIGTAAGFWIHPNAGILILILCALLLLIFFLFTRKRYRDLAALSERIDFILHENDILPFDMYHEGELSILQSEIYKMTVRLREQTDHLKREKVYLADAMADIAHQLRTPLTSLRMIVSFLGKPNLEEQKRLELSREMEVLLSRIDWLLTTLLKISKIDAGTAIFQHEPVSVDKMLQKALEPLLIPLEIHELTLHIKQEENVQYTGDLNWTAEGIGNIIKNCMEHTPPGGAIYIDCRKNALYTELVIRDNGCGIASEDLPHVFERFYQGKNPKEGNFGVGLALCRMILTEQNATIKAANHPEGGACFTIRFFHHVI